MVYGNRIVYPLTYGFTAPIHRIVYPLTFGNLPVPPMDDTVNDPGSPMDNLPVARVNGNSRIQCMEVIHNIGNKYWYYHNP